MGKDKQNRKRKGKHADHASDALHYLLGRTLGIDPAVVGYPTDQQTIDIDYEEISSNPPGENLPLNRVIKNLIDKNRYTPRDISISTKEEAIKAFENLLR